MSESTIRHNQVLCFVSIWLAYCVTYFVRKPLGVIKSEMGAELGVGKAALGWCDTALILPYAGLQIGLPGLSDKYGPRKVLVICLIVSGMGCWVTGKVYNIVLVNLALFVTGAALAPAWPACSKMLNAWFPDNRLNSVFGMINTATYSGGLGGTALAAAMQEYSGWRSVFLIPTIMAGVTALLVSSLLKMPAEKGIVVPGKEEAVLTNDKDEEKAPSAGLSFTDLFGIPCVKEVCSGVFCLKFVRYMMYMWLPLYLLEHLHYTQLQAGMFSTVFDIGGIVGSPLLGVVLDKYFRTTPLYGNYITILMAGVAVSLFILTSSWGSLYNGVFLFIVGVAICGPDSILAGSVTMEIGERNGRKSGSGVTSLVNGVGSMGGILEGPLIGLLWGVVGWGGVLSTVVIVTFIGALFVYRAHIVDQGVRAKNTLPS